MYGGYYAGLPPDQGDNWTHYYHNGAFYSDPRISAYIGMGLHQMPGNVWWRSWRELPPPAPFPDCQATDPDFSWQGQWPMPGTWVTYTDPQSGQQFPVWEGHYLYTGADVSFIPTFAGGMFEGLMANEIVPETSWGPHSFGRADERTARVQIKYATEQLHYPVWACHHRAHPMTAAATAASASRAWRSRTSGSARTLTTRIRGSRNAMAAPPRTWSRHTRPSSRWT